MNIQWQTTIVMGAVGAAVAYLARVAWLSIARRKAAACGGCRQCPSGSSGEPVSLVGVEQLAASAAAAKNERP